MQRPTSGVGYGPVPWYRMPRGRTETTSLKRSVQPATRRAAGRNAGRARRVRAGRCGCTRPEGRPRSSVPSVTRSPPATRHWPTRPPRSRATRAPRSSRSTPRTPPGRPSATRSATPPSSSTSATATAGRPAIATRCSRRARTASGSTPSPAVTTRPTSTSARRRSTTSSWRRTPSCCSTTCATRRATRSPGLPEGTVDQAVQRVDNYAAGFIRAGAAAVVAEGHLGPAWYVRQLLTGKGSIESIWNRSPNANGNTFKIPSVRSQGLRLAARPRQPLVRLLPLARVPWRHHGQRRQVRARWARSRTRSPARRPSRRSPTRP